MSIHDFHSKLTSEREEGRLFEALRRLKGIESLKAVAAQEPATWNQWTDGSEGLPGSSLATAKA
jgi:hypothetical protein